MSKWRRSRPGFGHGVACAVCLVALALACRGQAGAKPGEQQAKVATVPRDVAVDEADALVGRATIVRGCYSGGTLAFDAAGHVKGEPKQVDWTLSGVDIKKVTRPASNEIELDGVRVAIRYVPDQHVFNRKEEDDKLKIVLDVNDGARGLEGALATVFSVGIDPGLQRAMPAYWRHYFAPAMAWPNDDLTGQTILLLNMTPTPGVEFPVMEKKAEPEFTAEAARDRVKGVVQLRMTVGADGVPRRIFIKQPLGYGLDARAVATAARYRFRPAMKDGKPVAAELQVNQAFD